MIPISLYEIAFILQGKCIGSNLIINTISIDSRVIRNSCMFIALKGKYCDGHDFIEHAIISGAQALLVDHYLSINIPQIIVFNTYDALEKISSWIRNQVSTKVIAITGSSGKTSVKEMTSSILGRSGVVVATQKNYNNLIGVPITLLNLTYQCDFAVIELGASVPGELSKLSKMVTADVALVNNIFLSHLSGFKSLSVIKKEKGKIFSNLSSYGQAVINFDNHALPLWHMMLKSKKIWSFSLLKKTGVNFFASDIILSKYGTKFILHSPCGVMPVFLPLILGHHSVYNALASSALAFSVGADLFDIIYGLQNMQALPGRLFPIFLNKGKLLVLDDTYNSNVGSMIAAINVLNIMPGYRILVLSDMLELGDKNTIEYHCYIGKFIVKTNINFVLTVGNLSYFISKFCNRGKHFQNKITLISYLNKILFKYQYISILIKGSRCFRMEKVVDAIKDGL